MRQETGFSLETRFLQEDVKSEHGQRVPRAGANTSRNGRGCRTADSPIASEGEP